MKPEPSAAGLGKRYAELVSRLNKTGLILQGTITSRTIPRATRRGKTRKAYGPYYQWTWKDKGKTVTVNLSPSQFDSFQKAISNHRRLQKTLREMRLLSRQILEATTEGVAKRKRRA